MATDRTSKSNLSRIVFALLVAAFLASRICLFAQSPQEWDTVNYALGVESFSIADHRPHAPGSILYIQLARAVDVVVGDVIRTLLLINLAFGLVGLIATYRIARTLGGSRDAGNLAVFLYIANPLVWYYGLVAEIYSVEAAFSALNALLLLRFLRTARERDILVATAFLGLSGGFRLNVAVFLLPLWLATLLTHRLRPPKARLPRYPLLLAAVTAVWFVPTIIHCGSLSEYLRLSRMTIRHSFELHSVLFGAAPAEHAKMLVRLAAWYFIGAGVPTIGCIALLMRKPRTWPARGPAAFLALWMAPSALFFVLILAAKPGYLLFVLPGAFVIISLLAASYLRSSRAAWLFVALVSLPGLGYFFGPGLGADDIPSQIEGRPLPRFFRFTLNAVRYRDDLNQAFSEFFAGRADPARSVFVFSRYATWNFRIANFYFSDVEQHRQIFFPSWEGPTHIRFQGGRLEEVNDGVYELPNQDTYVFFHEMSSWGQELVASGLVPLRGRHDATCFLIPAEVHKSFDAGPLVPLVPAR